MQAPAHGDEGSGGGALGTAREESAKEKKKGRRPFRSPIYGGGGIPERFPIFPPTISTIVGGICFVSRDTWRYPERSIRPHQGHTAPTVRFRIGCGSLAREPKRRRACAEALECVSAQTGRRVGPGSVSRIHREINDRDSLGWYYPVAGFASRLRQSRWEDLGKKISGRIDLDMEYKDGIIGSRKMGVV